MKITWSPLALERVQGIARYIAKDKPSAADKWVRGLFEIVGRLALHPRSCRIVPELNREDVREVIYSSYRVIYKITDEIDILTVRHSRQLLDTTEIISPDL